jgi:hypothetical protein
MLWCGAAGLKDSGGPAAQCQVCAAAAAAAAAAATMGFVARHQRQQQHQRQGRRRPRQLLINSAIQQQTLCVSVSVVEGCILPVFRALAAVVCRQYQHRMWSPAGHSKAGTCVHSTVVYHQHPTMHSLSARHLLQVTCRTAVTTTALAASPAPATSVLWASQCLTASSGRTSRPAGASGSTRGQTLGRVWSVRFGVR